MIASGRGGSIVLIASMSGSIVNYPQEQCAYNASKAGVIQLGRSLAAEWARHHIRVNCISPGYMDTALNKAPALEPQKKIWRDLTPQKRLGSPDELNGLALWLASDASTFTTGANIIVDVSISYFLLSSPSNTRLTMDLGGLLALLMGRRRRTKVAGVWLVVPRDECMDR